MSEERLDRLEARVQALEDELAIIRLVASYGPLVDAGEADAVAALWAEDGDLRRRGLADAQPRRRPRDGPAPTATST